MPPAREYMLSCSQSLTENTVKEGDELQKESILAQELSSYSLIERYDSASLPAAGQ